MPAHRTKILLTLFLLSGFVGVLTEQIFERLLSVVVGGTTPAAAVVLSVYFTGLGIGGWAAARMLKRSTASPLRMYGFAEGAVAAACMVVFLGFDAVTPGFAGILVWAAGDPAPMLMARVLVATVVVLPPAFAMGLSFPFLSQIANQISSSAGVYIARLYMANLFGAAIAAASAPYLLLPYVGLSGALALCAAIDAGVAFYAIRTAGEATQSVPEKDTPASGTGTLADYPLLAIAFLSGFIFFSLEIVWTQIVAVVINSSVYAFSSMLFFVTLGLGLGARAVAQTIERGKEKPNLGFMFLVTAGLLFVQTWLWPGVPHSMAVMGFGVENFYLGESIRWLHLAMLLLPVTFLYGMVYPALFNDRRIAEGAAGKLIGYMGAVNAVGCVLGAVVASFYLLPRVGSEASLRYMIVALAVCGVAMFCVDGRFRSLRGAIPVAAALAWITFSVPNWDPLQFTSGVNVHFARVNVFENSKLLYFHEDAYGGVTTVVYNDGGPGGKRKVLLTNGKFQGDDGEQINAQIGFTAIPTLHLANRDEALVIGFGTGQSAAVLKGLGYREVTVAEISPGILEASRLHFSEINDDIQKRQAVKIVVEDGRNVLLTHPKPYDLIAMEVSSVWFSGATNIYSKGFYDLARRRLKLGGVFQQWVQLHHIGPKEVESILATVRASFPWVEVWYFGGQGVIVAAEEPRTIVPESKDAIYQYVLKRRKGNVDQAKAYIEGMLRSRLMDRESVERLWASKPIVNDDWNRWLEYATPRYNLTSNDWVEINVAKLTSYGEPVSAKK